MTKIFRVDYFDGANTHSIGYFDSVDRAQAYLKSPAFDQDFGLTLKSWEILDAMDPVVRVVAITVNKAIFHDEAVAVWVRGVQLGGRP